MPSHEDIDQLAEETLDFAPQINYFRRAEPEHIELFRRFHEAAQGIEFSHLLRVMTRAESSPMVILEDGESPEDGESLTLVYQLWYEINDTIEEPWRAIESFDKTTISEVARMFEAQKIKDPVKPEPAKKVGKIVLSKDQDYRTITNPDRNSAKSIRRMLNAVYIGRITPREESGEATEQPKEENGSEAVEDISIQSPKNNVPINVTESKTDINAA